MMMVLTMYPMVAVIEIYDGGVNRVYSDNGVLLLYVYMLMVFTVYTMEWCLSLCI